MSAKWSWPEERGLIIHQLPFNKDWTHLDLKRNIESQLPRDDIMFEYLKVSYYFLFVFLFIKRNKEILKTFLESTTFLRAKCKAICGDKSLVWSRNDWLIHGAFGTTYTFCHFYLKVVLGVCVCSACLLLPTPLKNHTSFLNTSQGLFSDSKTKMYPSSTQNSNRYKDNSWHKVYFCVSKMENIFFPFQTTIPVNCDGKFTCISM